MIRMFSFLEPIGEDMKLDPSFMKELDFLSGVIIGFDVNNNIIEGRFPPRGSIFTSNIFISDILYYILLAVSLPQVTSFSMSSLLVS